jgi:F0F1-type ATP synthase assembly protein I
MIGIGTFMWMYWIKLGISALIIVIVTEVAKRSGYVGGLIKSLPLISVISFIWLYYETKDLPKIASLSEGTFWFVIPTLPAFLLFPCLLRHEVAFWPSLGLSIGFMLACYLLTIFLLGRLGITF